MEANTSIYNLFVRSLKGIRNCSLQFQAHTPLAENSWEQMRTRACFQTPTQTGRSCHTFLLPLF